MSVAVSPYLPHSQTLGFAGGQQADLLDALVASCQKSSMNPKLPGYGRILQPYFATDPMPSKTPAVNGKLNNKGKGRSKKPRGKAHCNSASSSSDEEATYTTKTSPVAIGSPNEPTIKAVYCGQKVGGTVWAGPTFGMAPSVLEIPFPSDFLLH